MAFETFSLVDGITSILRQYPFGVGLFREILQNSDDAKAEKQIFILDHRTHSTDHLCHPDLADTQGPALLAYNDAVFEKADWEHIRSIQNSSKKTDTSKIGKYGIGFRSCYHVCFFFRPHPHPFKLIFLADSPHSSLYGT
jgi:sacsin